MPDLVVIEAAMEQLQKDANAAAQLFKQWSVAKIKLPGNLGEKDYADVDPALKGQVKAAGKQKLTDVKTQWDILNTEVGPL